MTPDGKAFLRDLALLVGLPLAIAIGLSAWLVPWGALLAELDVTPYAPPDGDVFAVAEGRWDWTTRDTFCEDNHHRIRFSADRATMIIEHAGPVEGEADTLPRETVYDILAFDSTSIRGQIRGEDRLDDSGNPLIWDLVLTQPDAYRWHETTWAAGSYTAEIRRCPADEVGEVGAQNAA